jgi:hypothetical protein
VQMRIRSKRPMIPLNTLECAPIANNAVAAKCGRERDEGNAENERSEVGFGSRAVDDAGDAG